MSVCDSGPGWLMRVAMEEEGHVVSREKCMDFESGHTHGIGLV